MAASGDFVMPTFVSVCRSEHSVVGLITRPDRPAGRGRRLRSRPVKDAAVEAGVPVLQPRRIGEAQVLDWIARASPDVLLVVAYGQKVPPEICRLPSRGALNLHGSLLPALRGAAPCNWAIIRGLKETGVTVQYLAQEMDAGDVLARRAVSVGPRETAPSLHDRLAGIGAEVVLDVLAQIEAGTQTAEAQDPTRVTYAPRLKKEDGRIDWRRSPEEVDRRVRGLKPWPRAYTDLRRSQGDRLRVILEEVAPREGPGPEGGPPGTVLATRPDLVVAAGKGSVRILSLKPASSRVMSGSDFCNGHNVRVGDTFDSPGAENG